VVGGDEENHRKNQLRMPGGDIQKKSKKFGVKLVQFSILATTCSIGWESGGARTPERTNGPDT